MSPIHTRLMVNFQEIIYYNWLFSISFRHWDLPPVGILSHVTTYEMASTIARPIVIEQAA